MTPEPTASDERSDDSATSLHPAPEGGADARRLDRRTLASVLVSLGVAALALWREAETAPYHIDELRQVRPYALGFDALLDSSYAQEQPPLDVIVGAGMQRVLGVGDVLQRSHSMLAGLLALACLAMLMWRRGARLAIPATILLLAFVPTFPSHTSYARPYALPLALMIGYLLAVDLWLEQRRWWWGSLVAVIAALLPLSRVFEPPALLVLASVTLVVFRRWNPQWGRAIWLPVGAAAAALLLVELPVYLRLQSRLTAYQGDAAASLGDQWQRIVDDSLPRLGDVLVNWWIVLVLVIAAAATPWVRRWLVQSWWFWPVLAMPVAFFVAFHLRTQPGQPYYERYGYYFLPAVAIALGLLAESAVRAIRRPTSPLVVATNVVVAALLAVLGAQLVVATVDDLRNSDDSPDYAALGREIETRLPVSTSIVFDSVGRPLGRYRPGYAGYGRYTSPARQVVNAKDVVQSPAQLREVGQYAIGTRGPVIELDGWEAVEASESMTLYVSESERSGPVELASDLVRFGEAVDTARGAMLRLAAAQLLFEVGDAEGGCAVVAALLAEDRSVAGGAAFVLGRSVSPELAMQCLEDLPE